MAGQTVDGWETIVMSGQAAVKRTFVVLWAAMKAPAADETNRVILSYSTGRLYAFLRPAASSCRSLSRGRRRVDNSWGIS